jgi:ribonuclease HII
MAVTFRYERQLLKQGHKLIAGVDEVGCGPLAGPLVAAAVMFPPDCRIKSLNDSKKLSAPQREALYKIIKAKAIGIGIARINHREIDRINIWQANLLAMKLAVEALPVTPDFLLIDGSRHRIALPIKQLAIAGGDGKCASIAAASIIAKVTRDRLMIKYHAKYPDYGFDRHKGYGTRLHFQRLKYHGPCAIHRRSFCLNINTN